MSLVAKIIRDNVLMSLSFSYLVALTVFEMQEENFWGEYPLRNRVKSPEGTPILGHIRDVRPEWMSFPGQKPADGCKFLTRKLWMGHNFDIISHGNGWFSSKLNKTYCSSVNFCCK